MDELKSTAMIVFVSALLFMGLTMAQEWSLFRPLFIREAVPVSEKIPDETERAIKFFNAMMVHYYASAGDERFLQRIPASDQVRGEFFKDAEYLRENGVVQVMKLSDFKVSSARKVREGRYIIETEEEWTLHYEDLDGNRFDPRDQNFKVLMKYYCEKGPEGYNIARMEPLRED